jgi:hypothetical protein
MVCSCLSACGPDGYHLGDWNVRFERILPELDRIQYGYWHFLKASPQILENLVWADDKHPEGYIFIDDEEKVRDLAAHLAGEACIPLVPDPSHLDNGQAFYSEPDAWNIYLAHVAHALKIEVHNMVAWSLSDYSSGELALLFDGRYLFDFVPSRGLYKFSSRFPGGRQGVTDWDAGVGYEFLERHGMIGTQAETVYNFTNWLRRNLVHVNNNTPEDWDGYPGCPPVEKILSPPEWYRHWTQGCAATSSLYITVLQSVNIPVSRGASYFATRNGPEQAHHRVEFPTLGIGLAHSDDAHNELARRSVNEVPVETLFYSIEQLAEFIDDPVLEYGAPSRGEQTFCNMYRRAVGNAYDFRADPILKRRARDLLGSGDRTMEDLLMARVCDGSDCLWKPPFDLDARALMIEEIDSTLAEIGSGDVLKGSRIVLGR